MSPTRAVVALGAAAAAAVVVLLGSWALCTAPRGAGGSSTVALDAGRPRPQGDFYVGAAEEPHDLNPFTTQEQVARRAVLRYTHDALLELDPADAQLRGALAQAWEVLDGGRRAVFTLRDGARFSDGSPLASDDVLFTWEAARDPALPLGALREVIDLIADARALDARRLELSLKSTDPIAFAKVATGYTVVSRRFFAGRALRDVREPGPGTGPFALQGWQPGVELTLVQNPHSWARRALPSCWNLAGLRLRFLRDAAAQLVALRRQEIDVLFDADPQARLRDDPELARQYLAHEYEHASAGAYVALWNCRHPPLDDARVRRALTMLFDREAVARGLFAGHARVPAGWFRPGHPAHVASAAPLPFDPALARQLVAAAVPGERRALSLLHATPAEAPVYAQIAELAQPAFARAGLSLLPEPLPWSRLQERLFAGEFDGVLLVLGGDPWQDPYPFFHSSQRDGGRNWMGYASAEVDRLLDAARAEVDTARRAARYRELEERLAEDQPLTLLLRPLATVLLHRRFRDAEPGALGLVPEQWWVPLEEQRYR